MTTFIADTNVFLRFLTNDVPEQAAQVEKRFRQAQKDKLQLVVLPIAIIEIVYQLENWYKLSRKEAVEKVITLIRPSWIIISNKPAVLTALDMYQDNAIDLVDLLMWSIAKTSKSKVLSFDKDFDRLTPKLRIEP